MLVAEVDDKIRRLPGVRDVKVELVWEPPWEPSRMSEAAKLQLGML
jgi:metal-sulfur cluster biosynthetic enzyme